MYTYISGGHSRVPKRADTQSAAAAAVAADVAAAAVVAAEVVAAAASAADVAAVAAAAADSGNSDPSDSHCSPGWRQLRDPA